MTESKLQTKIINDLKKNGHYVIKTVLTNRNGIADLIGCTFGKGKFFAIEVKKADGKETALQELNRNRVIATGGLAAVVYTWEQYLEIKNKWEL